MLSTEQRSLESNNDFFQDSLVSQEPKIKTACVSVAKSHLTLHVFRASEDQIPYVSFYKISLVRCNE